MPLPDPRAVTDWTAPITVAAKRQMNGTISLYDPALTTVVDGVDEFVRVWHPKARIQQFSDEKWEAPLTITTGRRFEFQCEISLDLDDVPMPDIREGMFIRVNDGGKFPALTQYVYTITSAVNSSHAALVTIKASSGLQIAPPIIEA